MNEMLYDVFQKAFVDTSVSYEEFISRLDLNDSTVLKYFEPETGELIGFSVVRENCISLLCVLPEHQNKGIGTTLLKQSENLIAANGYNEIFLGYKGETTSLFKGVPLSKENYLFFSKHQYDNDFTVCDYEIALPPYIPQTDDAASIYNANSSKELTMLFLRFLEGKDKKMYNKYCAFDNIDYIFVKNGSNITGVCAYSIDKDNRTLNLYDVVSYPNYDVQSKKLLLNEMAQISATNDCDKVIVRDVSNPSFYKDYSSTETKKYWRGSKSC